ncbi:MAG TPA: 50S ribosomal protein L9, partial [Verrucomicrobiota bacterium]|nr:50S ribosomal protein L9 [Verrucomicrobiota bacterium]
DAKELSSSFKHLILQLKVKTGDTGKMYGSVTPANIVEQLNEQFEIKIDRRKIYLDEPIRTVGDHNVELRLHHEVSTTLKVRVESTNPLPVEVSEVTAEVPPAS